MSKARPASCGGGEPQRSKSYDAAVPLVKGPDSLLAGAPVPQRGWQAVKGMEVTKRLGKIGSLRAAAGGRLVSPREESAGAF